MKADYSWVVMIRRSIMRTKFTKESSVEDKDKNNESYINSQNKDENDKDFTSIKYKGKKFPIESNEDT